MTKPKAEPGASPLTRALQTNSAVDTALREAIDTLRETETILTAVQGLMIEMRLAKAWQAGGPLNERISAAIRDGEAALSAPCLDGPARREAAAVLPCDVLVAPATIIRKGCKISTLMAALEQRVGRDVPPIEKAPGG